MENARPKNKETSAQTPPILPENRTSTSNNYRNGSQPKRIKNPFWLPINVETYRADTADLSTLEHGAYFLLHLHYWRTGPLKNDDIILARITGLSIPEWRRVRPTLERFFDIGCEWVNWAWSAEVEAAYNYIQRASNAGKKANAQRWGRDRKNKSEVSESDHNRTPNRIRNGVPSESEHDPNYNVGGSPPTPPCPAKQEVSSSGSGFDADVAHAETAFLGEGGHE